MDSPARYRLNGSRIIHEGFENEVVVVNLESGRYYCVQHAGADAWHLLVGGRSDREIARVLAARYAASEVEIVAALDVLFRELQDQELIVPAHEHEATGAISVHAVAAAEAIEAAAMGERQPFAAPHLQTYTDMQDLLVLDPIHEVDPEGWPVMRVEEARDPSDARNPRNKEQPR